MSRTLASMGGAPAGYDATAYGRDFKLFRAFANRNGSGDAHSRSRFSGRDNGRVGCGLRHQPQCSTRGDLLVASGPGVDAFSYHHYGATSTTMCCHGTQADYGGRGVVRAMARANRQTLAFYRKLRDEFEPGKPFWNTETADTACGGNPWGGTFLDTFRYLDQLGRLAKQEVHVVAHNTLVASDYGLLDEKTFYTEAELLGRSAVAAG